MNALAPGFLIAMPQLGDPNFNRAVILMIEHGEGGAMGLVLNREAPLSLKEVAKGQELHISETLEDEGIYIGGPVEPQRGFVLHDSEEVEERHEVLPGLFLSVTMDAFAPMLKRGGMRLRFCLGYAGWGAGQLEQEIAQGAWLFTEATQGAVLDGNPEQLWEETLRGMGVEPAMLFQAKGVN